MMTEPVSIWLTEAAEDMQCTVREPSSEAPWHAIVQQRY